MNINHKVSFAAVGLLLLMSLSVFSQSAKIDSLKSIVNTEAKDTIMVSSLNNLGLELLNQGNIDESIKYSEKAKDLSTELGYIKGKALSLKQIGNANYYRGNYLEVFDYWTQSLENYEILKDSVGISNLLSNLGIVYFNQGSNAEAIDYLLRSLRIAEKLKHPLRIATSLVNVAAVYADSPQDWDKALKYYEQVFPYLKIINDPANSKAYYFGVGEIEYSKGNYQVALKYFEEALEITKNTLFYSENLLLVGKTKFKLGEVEECISLLNQCYSYAVKDNNLLAKVKCLIELGIIYQNNNFKKAINSYKEAEILATDSDLSYELAEIYDGISQTYVNNGDFKKGYQYQAKYVSQKDSIFNLETNDKMRGLQFGFDLQKKEDEIGLLEKEAEILELKEKRQKIIKYITFLIAGLILLLAMALFRRYKYVRKTNRIIEEEKNRSEKLLLNILPEETANELKENGKVQAKQFSAVTVLFTDFVGFTRYSENLSPEALVETIGFYFSKFDEIIKKYGLEKIKTIGDAYMCAGGLPFPTEDHAHKMLLAAFEIAEFVDKTKKNEEAAEKLFDIRIGMNTGPVVAGVVGSTKFAYDIWGDTVNVASRMESMSEPGKINISENTYALIKEDFECEFRGEIEAKNRGKLKMYFVTSSKDKEIETTIEARPLNV